jgi:hypothetical protein
MKVTVSIDDAVSFELDANQIENLVAYMDDTEENIPIFDALSRYPAYAVRASVATKDNLTDEAVAFLAKDTQIDVLRRLVGSAKFREVIDEETVLEMITRDVEVAESVAHLVGDLKMVRNDTLSNALVVHPEPRVRRALAGNGSAPKRVIKRLTIDEDRGVRTMALSMRV